MVMRMEDLLAEDEGYGDITSELLIENEGGESEIVANEDCVVAGLAEATELFKSLDLDARAQVEDGCQVKKGTAVMTIHGPLKAILLGERLALNFIMRMSGIATVTSKTLWDCRRENKNVRIAATRKTTPGFRFYEKKAVVLGGGDPHRNRLDDMILIKDNHLVIVGSVTEAVRKAKTYSFSKKVEVEVVVLDQAKEAAVAGADIIMLDNMSPKDAEESYFAIKEIDPRITVEVSGGITPHNAAEYAKHADVLSLGWITHSAKAIQFSLSVTKVYRF
ncbi:MAG TPA: carboxylating nicotinate-nucleotide diphosphorylase [Methanomassiliicoccales archaeon]|jgi:nicotinate-nucleotide pyrophosphorylase (carboxylating)